MKNELIRTETEWSDGGIKYLKETKPSLGTCDNLDLETIEINGQ